jgi:hypothetical protein
MEFLIGLFLGLLLSLYVIYYLEKNTPDNRPTPSGGVPFMKKKPERKKPVVIDEAKEWRKEQEQRKEGR